MKRKVFISKGLNTSEILCIEDGTRIKSISLSHDVADIRGYIIEENDSSMVYITDTGYINEKVFKEILNKNIYVFESNHDVEMLMNNPKYPHHTKIRILSDKGHLSNEDAAKFCIDLVKEGTERILLAHLSKENNFPELAYETSKSILAQNDIIIGQDIKLDVLLREEVSDIYKVK